MAGTVFRNVKLSGLAAAAPTQVIHNKDFSSIIGEDTLKRVIKVTGIEEFHKAIPKQTAGDLCYEAAKHLLEEKNIDRSEIGACILVTEYPDYVSPSTAYIIHKRLRLNENCMSFDVNLGCSGYVYGVHLASSLLQSMKQKYVLLCAGQVPKLPSMEGRKNPEHSNVIMFGDAGTASVFERNDNSMEIETDLFSLGEKYRALVTFGRCRSMEVPRDEIVRWSDGFDRSPYDPYMDGMEVFNFSTTYPPKSIREMLERRGETVDDYDAFYFHQANKMIVNRIGRILNIDRDKIPMSISRYGNTGCATVPVTMSFHLGEDETPKNIKCFMSGFGIGLSWGNVSMAVNPKDILPMIYTDDYYAEGEYRVI